MKKIVKETIVLFVKGCAIGVANIIPGVSGGTIAVILGIYDRLIESIANFFENPSRRGEYILFLFRIILGAVTAIILLANVMSFLLTNYFYQTMFLFMGLIIGGIPAVLTSHSDMRIRISRILTFVLGMLMVLSLSIASKWPCEASVSFSSGMAVVDIKTLFVILLSGFLAGGAMIVPGISGSFILVLMGQYALIINALKNLFITPLIFFAIGASTGILVFSKIIKKCLEKGPALTYYFILGLITASLCKIFPGIPEGATPLLFCAAAFLTGGSISYCLSKN
ncbi:MAG: DUF368 domain-containing protein [Candidatus Omnitrophota bacterium]